jgi:hypothetical protein
MRFLTKENILIVLGITVFYALNTFFVPKQEDYYLKSDITNLEDIYYWKIVMISILIVSIIYFTISIFKKRNGNEKLNKFIRVLIFSFGVLILLDSIIISTILLLNRMKTEYKITEVFKVILAEKENLLAIKKNPDKMIFYDDYIRFHKIKTNQKFNVNDTLVLNYNQGVFGIKFIDKK